jgi:hypothetical protein
LKLIGLLVLEKIFKNTQCILLFRYYLPLEKGNPLHLNNLESLPPRMICAKPGLNWPNGSGEKVENVKVYRQTDRQSDRRRTTGDQKSSLELSAQVS